MRWMNLAVPLGQKHTHEYLAHSQTDARGSSKINSAGVFFGNHCIQTHNYFSEVFFFHTGIRTEPERNSWSDLFIFGLSHKLPTLIFD